jgi:hypothetical protein
MHISLWSRVHLLAIVLALSGCGRSENYEQARYVESGTRYEVTLRGKRLLMAHDPISALQGKTYEDRFVLDLPRLSGLVRGDEIPVRPGYYNYLGQIEFKDGRMVVDLYINNTDDGTKDALSWNGQYTLVK